MAPSQPSLTGLALVSPNPAWTREELLAEMLHCVALMRRAEMPCDKTLHLYIVNLQRFNMQDISAALLRVARTELQKWEPRFPELGLLIRAVREEAEYRHLVADGERFKAQREEWLRNRRLELEAKSA